jgi:hypothetical protein
MHDARPEFRDGGRLLGYPLSRDGALELALSAATLASLQAPSAWLSGRRLDGPTPTVTFATATAEAPSPARRSLSGRADPGEPGPYGTVRLSYRLPDLVIVGYETPLEVLAEVIAPVGAPGPRPLVVFLHGHHETCYFPGRALGAEGGWPCPEGALPVPSYQGYRYVAELLASQGYITVSISANSINAQADWAADAGAAARSALVRHHLALWAGWADAGGDPWGGRFLGRVDLGRVVLVGHSRGGEGVVRAAIDATHGDGYGIVGLVPIAPTAFGRQMVAGVATAVILPYCDGDVVDLQGQQYVDQSRDLAPARAVRSAVLVMGANHNFFNTEWTPGLAAAPANDDWLWAGSEDDPTCGPAGTARLTPVEQQAVGATYIAALARAAVDRDAAAMSLLDGSRVRAASAGRARVLTHALGGRRSLVYRPRLSDFIATAGLSARVCRGYVGSVWPPLGGGLKSDCAPEASLSRLPHWLPMMGAESAPSQVALDMSWQRIGGKVRVSLGAARNLSTADSLDLRVAVDPASPGVNLGLRLVDRRGAVADLPAAYRISALPGTQSPLGKIWGQTLRFSLDGVSGIDLSAVTGIELVSRTSHGRAWLVDIFARRPGATQSAEIELPRVSVGSTEVPEGGPGLHTHYLPLEIRGRITRPAALWVSIAPPEGEPQGYRLVLPPGTIKARIPVTVEGNDTYEGGQQEFKVTLKALSQAATGEYIGTLTVVDDEPAPALTLEAAIGRVIEGGAVVFSGTLPAPTATDLW